MFDFTDPAHPKEIAYFDRGPIDATKLVSAATGAGYYYNGYIYGSEIARGLDVFKLTPTADLTQNEIDAAKLVHFDSSIRRTSRRSCGPRHSRSRSPTSIS